MLCSYKFISDSAIRSPWAHRSEFSVLRQTHKLSLRKFYGCKIFRAICAARPRSKANLLFERSLIRKFTNSTSRREIAARLEALKLRANFPNQDLCWKASGKLAETFLKNTSGKLLNCHRNHFSSPHKEKSRQHELHCDAVERAKTGKRQSRKYFSQRHKITLESRVKCVA